MAMRRTNTFKKEKAGIFVEDLAVLLNHHWIRDEEVFAYKRLRLFPPLSRDERPRIVLKLKQFAFREDDMLIYDPLILIIMLAFTNHAPEDIYKLVKDKWRKRPVFRDERRHLIRLKRSIGLAKALE
ncbi:hypothetical protein QBC46DRAFT_368380 [Diplogelasinospora grovesii]|uniref:Uncharacterized protein n=1 Tax=Diplogelasinospora grovesii TaxID=303347 RepID=A0AAN6MVQ2_9PEZI|nr:hypothetical protein QBC46DRAFT_368380 [Diplogelasinospora grovesii]